MRRERKKKEKKERGKKEKDEGKREKRGKGRGEVAIEGCCESRKSDQQSEVEHIQKH